MHMLHVFGCNNGNLIDVLSLIDHLINSDIKIDNKETLKTLVHNFKPIDDGVFDIDDTDNSAHIEIMGATQGPYALVALASATIDEDKKIIDCTTRLQFVIAHTDRTPVVVSLKSDPEKFAYLGMTTAIVVSGLERILKARYGEEPGAGFTAVTHVEDDVPPSRKIVIVGTGIDLLNDVWRTAPEPHFNWRAANSGDPAIIAKTNFMNVPITRNAENSGYVYHHILKFGDVNGSLSISVDDADHPTVNWA